MLAERDNDKTSVIVLDGKMNIADLVAVARYGAKVEFSEEYCQRVKKSRSLVEKWIGEGRVMYGITTGFGAMCTQVISPEETAQPQKNIVLSHAVSVGEPLAIEEVRATIFMVLQNVGQGFCGARLETVELYRQFLNRGLTPFAPGKDRLAILARKPIWL